MMTIRMIHTDRSQRKADMVVVAKGSRAREAKFDAGREANWDFFIPFWYLISKSGQSFSCT